jgi:hypothetical protein
VIAPLLLHTPGSLTLRARAVLCGETYQDGRSRNDSLSTVVEFTVVGARGDRFLSAYEATVLERLLHDGFQPDPHASIQLDGGSLEELRSWLGRVRAGDSRGGELVALLVGEEAELSRAKVALAPLDLECRICPPGAAMQELRSREPALVVLDGGDPVAPQLLERVRANADGVPVIVLGGDGASADAWLPQPIDARRLVAVATELLDFV